MTISWETRQYHSYYVYARSKGLSPKDAKEYAEERIAGYGVTDTEPLSEHGQVNPLAKTLGENPSG